MGPSVEMAGSRIRKKAPFRHHTQYRQQRDGIERAKSKGDVYKGRKPTIDRLAVLQLFDEGIGASEIARRPKIGRASVYRVLEQ
jgi:DNA invertase Pin-like site-specific DNA recombinase